MGCISAGATPRAPSPYVCRTPESPPPHSASTSARTCTASGSRARSRADRWRSGRSRWRGRCAPDLEQAAGAATASSLALLLGRRDGPLSKPGFVDQLSEGRVHTLQALALGQLAGRRSCNEHHVLPPHKLPLGAGERFAQKALQAVALDGATDLPRHRQAQPRPLHGGVRERVEHGGRLGSRTSVAIHALDLGAARQPTATGGPRFHRAPVTVKQTGACVPCRGAASRSAARRASACARGTRARGLACASLAGRCASCLSYAAAG